VNLIECKITDVVVVVVVAVVVVVVTVVVVVVVVMFLSVTPSTKSTKFGGSRYLVDGLSEREEIWRIDTQRALLCAKNFGPRGPPGAPKY